MRGEALPTVSVIGLGYIGLPTAAIIARAGLQVRGVDVSQHVVDTINRGEIHIEEVDLDGLVHARRPARAAVGRDRSRAGRRVRDRGADPVRERRPHTPDVSYVLAAARKRRARCSSRATR